MKNSNALYNALPYIYTAGGIITLLISGEAIGKISGTLLVSAAMLIFHLRLEHRTQRAEKAERFIKASQRRTEARPVGI